MERDTDRRSKTIAATSEKLWHESDLPRSRPDPSDILWKFVFMLSCIVQVTGTDRNGEYLTGGQVLFETCANRRSKSSNAC